MSQMTVSDTGGLGRAAAVPGDPELARICELGELMALPPRDLLAKLKGDAEDARHGERREDDPAVNMPAIPALADLASIVSTLEQAPPQVQEPGREAWRADARPADRDSSPAQDEQPMPALSTWRSSPVPGQEDRWIGQNVRAAALGMLAGVAVVSAAILSLGGWLDRLHEPDARLPSPLPVERNAEPPAQPQSETPPALPSTTEQPPGLSETPTRTEPAASESAPAENAPAAVEPSPQAVVQEAARHIGIGDVTGARGLLAGAGTDPDGLLPYTLAETYDPNMLAAWGVRGVTPDIAKAKELYEEALRLGNEQARQRLEALQ